MARRFEDLLVWQKARELTRLIYALTKGRSFAKDFALRDQIRAATVSVMSNIAEGYERDSDAEFGHFLSIAKGSCGEVRSQLYVAVDQASIDDAEFGEASGRATELSRMLKGLTKTVRRR
jgi:four helix bundle protein